MLCPKCHTNNPDGEKYCKNCGFQLNASRICPECGAHNKHDTKFCRECGAGLSPVSSFRRDMIENQNESLFNKHRSLIIAAIILVLAIGAVTGIALYNNASSNTGGSDDGFSFFPLDNNTNPDIQVDDGNDTNESVNETNKTLNDTDKNKTSDKNKDNSTDKNKNATEKKISDTNNTASNNKTNKPAESVENHSKVDQDNKTKDTSSDSQSDKSSKVSSSDKSSKVSSSDSKSDKSSSIFPFTKSEESSKNTSSDSESNDSLADDSQNSSNESADENIVDEDDEVQENISEEDNQTDEESNEIDMADVPELAQEVQSTGYSFSSIEFDGKDLSQSQCIALFAKYISTSKSGSVEIPQVSSASSPSGEDLSQSISKQDYMAVASDVNSYVSANGRIPDNAVISGDEESDISPSKILELLTKAIVENFPESVDI